MFGNIIVGLNPHFDDEVVYMGILSRLLKSGVDKIFLVYFSYPRESEISVLDKEQAKIVALLREKAERNIQVVTIKHIHRARELDRNRQDILEFLISVKKACYPTCVFCPCSYDVHQDHKTVYQEAIRAFKDTTIIGYNCYWNILKKENTENLYATLLEDDLKLILDCADVYKSQNKIFLETENITAIAKAKGLEIKKEYAQVFELIRGVM